MQAIAELAFSQFIQSDGDKLITDSRRVAAVHGKQHAKILKLIRQRIVEAGSWGVANFGETHYRGSNGEAYPMFTMTQAGYQFIVGKMTGKRAVAHQIAFINAFEAMRAYIVNQREGLQYRCLAKEFECKDSARRGSYHGKGLQQRKIEKPLLEAELDALHSMAQPSLLN